MIAERASALSTSLAIFACAAVLTVPCLGQARRPATDRELREYVRQLEEGDGQARREAALAIYEQGAAALPILPQLLRLAQHDEDGTRQLALAAMTSLGKSAAKAVPVLVQLLRHEDMHTQYWSCRVLAAIGLPEGEAAIPTLLDLLGNGPASVRRNAAITLGVFGEAVANESSSALRKAAEDRQAAVREQAVIALGLHSLANDQVAQTLRSRLDDPSADVRVEAALALWRVTGQAEAALDQLFRELRSRHRNLMAAEKIGEFREAAEPLVPRLIELLSAEDAEHRMVASIALGAIGPAAEAAIPALEELRKSPDEDTRSLALDALTKIRSAEETDPLVP